MRVRRLGLHDVRRFARLELELGPGLTLIRGVNGSGKTTLLEAIGFALFGAPLGRGDGGEQGAVREGASEARVEIEIEDRGEALRVRRSVGPAGLTAEIEERDSGCVLARGIAPVERVLAARLGVSDPGVLPGLFQRIVHLAQGELDRPFRLGAAERRAHFEPLFELGRYRRAAEQAGRLAQPFRDEARRLELDAARGEGTLKGYRETVSRIEAMATESAAATTRLGGARSRLQELDAETRAGEEHRETVEALQREREVAEEALRSRSTEEARVRALLGEAEEAERMVERGHAAHARWESLESECRSLETQRVGHDALRAEVAELERRLDAERAGIAREREALDRRLDENQREAESILLERDAIRAQLETLRGRARRFEGARSALALALERAERLRELLAAVEPAAESDEPDREAERRERAARRAEQAATAAAAEASAAEVAALQARAETEDDARALLREASEAATRLGDLLARVQRHLAEVRPAMGACPLLEQPCQNLSGKSLVAHFAAEVERLETSRGPASEAVRFAESRLAEARTAQLLLREREPRRPPRSAAGGAQARRPAEPIRPRPRAAGSLPRKLGFDEIGHHLSALSGVLGAIEPQVRHEPDGVRALIGAVAGAGERGPAAPRPREPRFELPRLDEIEQARQLAQEAEAASRLPSSPDRDAHLAELAAHLARAARRIHAATVTAEAEARTLLTENRAEARAGETRLLDSTKALESLSLERARIRAASKELSSKDLTVLDLELKLSDRRLKLGASERGEREVDAKRAEQAALLRDRDAYRAHALLAERVETYRDEWKRLERDRTDAASRLARLDGDLDATRQVFDPDRLERIATERDELHAAAGELQSSLRSLQRERDFLQERLAEMEEGRRRLLVIEAARDRALGAVAAVDQLAVLYRDMAGPVATALAEQVRLEASRLHARIARGAGTLGFTADFAVWLQRGNLYRPYAELARGEQTAAALALHLAMLRHRPGIGLVLLDEPTAHLDPARRSAFARALPAFLGTARDYLEQVVVVAHDDTFDAVADQVIELPSM